MSDYQSYRDLDIFQSAKKLAVEIHHMTMKLPSHELYEEGGQIRRSSKSVASNIVEGFARRNYKNEFLRYITIAWGECDETIVHLDFLYETGSLTDKELYSYFIDEYTKLSKKTNRFHNSVLKNHRSSK